jgi:hypothetical protein
MKNAVSVICNKINLVCKPRSYFVKLPSTARISEYPKISLILLLVVQQYSSEMPQCLERTTGREETINTKQNKENTDLI